jgi:hypothetical protein
LGKRDYGHREPRKSKKDAKKLPQVEIMTPPASVEVIKKGKKREAEGEF